MTHVVREGRFSMWLTESGEADQIVELCGDLTTGGQPLLVVDAGELLSPRQVSRLMPAATRSVQLMRMPSGMEPASFLSAQLVRIPQLGAAPRMLLAGILDRLAGSDLRARDAARELGRIKAALSMLIEAGCDITMVCRIESGLRPMGQRGYFVSSLCAMADEIHRSSDAQHYIDGAAAAIA